MSFRVLVVPEDPTHNGYILKPLIEALLARAGRPRASVQVLSNPRLTGFDHAVRALRDELADKYRHHDLWLFVPDADRANQAAMDALEKDLAKQGVCMLVCAAQPEVEIYACVGLRDKLGIDWTQARSHPQFKEQVFGPLLKSHGDSRRAGGGRDQLINTSLRNLDGLLQLCPELRLLLDRIVAVVRKLPGG